MRFSYKSVNSGLLVWLPGCLLASVGSVAMTTSSRAGPLSTTIGDDIRVNKTASASAGSSTPRQRSSIDQTLRRSNSSRSSKRCSIHGVLEISTSDHPTPRASISNSSSSKGLRHRPSLSESSFLTASSAKKNRFSKTLRTPVRQRAKDLDSPISDFKFPRRSSATSPLGSNPYNDISSSSSSNATDYDDSTTNVTSPGSDMGTFGIFDDSSTGTCFLKPQPNLQGIFISLANRERRVLEAREELLNAETELREFKRKWSTALKNGRRSLDGSSQSFSEGLSPEMTNDFIIQEREASIRRGSFTSKKRQISVSKSRGLGIFQIPYEVVRGTESQPPNTFGNSAEYHLDNSDMSSIYSSNSNGSLSDDPTDSLSEPDLTSSQSSSGPFYMRSLLRYIASLGSLILRELNMLLVRGTPDEEQPVTSIQPRYPSVVETYYGSMGNNLVRIGRSRPLPK